MEDYAQLVCGYPRAFIFPVEQNNTHTRYTPGRWFHVESLAAAQFQLWRIPWLVHTSCHLYWFCFGLQGKSESRKRRRRRKAYRSVCGCVSNVNMSSGADANGDQEQNSIVKADGGCFVNHGCVVLEGDESTSTSVWVISRLFSFANSSKAHCIV